MQDYSALEARLGHHFANIELLREALTHRSAEKKHYERLEFLGDAVLDLVVSEELFRRFPDATEGQLTRLRSQIVRGESLAEIATNMELGNYIIFGPGELKAGSHRRESILADILESIIGAIYLDAGIATARDFLQRVLEQAYQRCNPEEILKDAKTRLQEYLQAKGVAVPEYTVLEVSGPSHKQHFRVQCCIADMDTIVEGQGSSRKRAEQDAAEKMYQRVAHA